MPRHTELPDSLTPSAFHILLALADQARHGLGIVEEVERRTEGAVSLGPGTLYGTIKKLRAVGFIREAEPGPEAASPDPRRRYYELTPLGRAAVSEEARRLEILVKAARAKALLGSGVTR